MIPDMINNKKLNPIVTELFIRSRKFNISIVFFIQSYFKVLYQLYHQEKLISMNILLVQKYYVLIKADN